MASGKELVGLIGFGAGAIIAGYLMASIGTGWVQGVGVLLFLAGIAVPVLGFAIYFWSMGGPAWGQR